ncbi:hypothetical protein GCM10007391_17260 [Alteromonas halophila]|uniref:RDD domain-containing protein n=1 Tax=Alteromonas halophila TaxID=516698 RepID=A0A918JL21_9ALTE|nr:hypothetical protein GCM10007391_17260 [Alteromonas halophila]
MEIDAQTVGKHFMSIRIENLDGTQATLATILLKRMLPMQIVSLIPGIGQILVGFVDPLFIFTKQRRCVHDYIANTRVTRLRSQEDIGYSTHRK